MMTIVLAVGITLLAVLGLAAGVLMGRAPLKGSCGGLACTGLACDTCPNRKPGEETQ